MSHLAAHQAEPSWSAVLDDQDGVISRRQALLGGLSEDAWQWRLDTGRWQTPLPGVAVAHSGEVTAPERSRAGVLYAGRGAALTGDAGLVWLGMTLPAPTVVDVAVPTERRVVGRAFTGEQARLRPAPGAGSGRRRARRTPAVARARTRRSAARSGLGAERRGG